VATPSYVNSAARFQIMAGALGVALGTLACTAEVPRTSSSPPRSSGTVPTVAPTTPPPMLNVAWPVEFAGRASALRRLSRDELVTSMKGLTGQSPLRADLPEEQRSGHHPLRTSGASFVGTEVGKLFQVVKAFAATATPSVLTQSGCKLTGPAQKNCLLAWSKGFAERALRRTAHPEEAALYQSIVATAGGGADGDKPAMEGLLTAIFFAPSFLYRTEIGVAGATASAPRVLQPTELATKLSFFASLSPPDSELLIAAKNGSLANGTERLKQFDRIAKTNEGKRAISLFIHEWLGANESKFSGKSAAYVTGLSPTFAGDVRADADGFIDVVLASADPTVGNLLTGKGYVTDPVLDPVVAPSTASGFPTGDTPANERIGLLMHPQVIASHTKENGSSPFQLGYFLREALLCEKVGTPPAGATALARQNPPAGLTQRENLEYRTSASAVCTGCHAQFAPLGYSFIAFDPIGRWQTKDPSGKPWDLSGSITTAQGARLDFQTPADLVRAFAANSQVQGCFAQTALEWSLGRGLVASDAPVVTALDAAIKSNGGNVPNILRTIVGAPEFIQAAQVTP